MSILHDTKTVPVRAMKACFHIAERSQFYSKTVPVRAMKAYFSYCRAQPVLFKNSASESSESLLSYCRAQPVLCWKYVGVSQVKTQNLASPEESSSQWRAYNYLYSCVFLLVRRKILRLYFGFNTYNSVLFQVWNSSSERIVYSFSDCRAQSV